MKETTLLVIASLLSILLFTFHLADDIVLGIEKGDTSNLGAFAIFGVWTYATLLLRDRRWGYIIVLLASILSSGVPVIHMVLGKGIGIASRIAKHDGHFFFVWTLLALGVTAPLSVILCVRGLWGLRRRSASSIKNINANSLV